MSRVTELEKALTTLFRKGTEVGYTETEIDEFLENIDYAHLYAAPRRHPCGGLQQVARSVRQERPERRKRYPHHRSHAL